MKKIFTVISGVLGMIILATPVLAATTFLLTPTNIDVVEKENFTLMVSVDPKGIKNYTAKVELEYPAGLLEVKSFTFASDWIQLNQPGYDLIDNTNGLLIKTAGYPGGASELITFGAILFSAKKTGEGIIKIGEDSLVLDAMNRNVLGVLAEATVTIMTPLPPEEEGPAEEEEIIPEEVIPEEVIPEEEIPAPRPLFDILIEPIARQVRKGPTIPILVAIGILILIIVGYVIYRKRREKAI